MLPARRRGCANPNGSTSPVNPKTERFAIIVGRRIWTHPGENADGSGNDTCRGVSSPHA